MDLTTIDRLTLYIEAKMNCIEYLLELSTFNLKRSDSTSLQQKFNIQSALKIEANASPLSFNCLTYRVGSKYVNNDCTYRGGPKFDFLTNWRNFLASKYSLI